MKEGGYGGGSETPYFALPTTLKPGLEQLIVDEVQRQVPDAFNAPKGTQGVAPKSPEDSLRCMRTHDELEISLAAAEPHVTDPVAIDFGTDGRLWVAEMNDYGRGVYEEFEQGGRVRWLRDADNDGVFEEAHTFIDRLRFPTDVKVWRDGVLICDAPDILFARDTDGDGTADETGVLLTGFDVRNAQARVNSLRFGIDGFVYGSCGLFGGTITAEGEEPVELGARDFAFNPDRPDIFPVDGRTQQGRCRNDRGDWFGCTNGTLLTHYGESAWRGLPEAQVGRTHPPIAFGPHALNMFPPEQLVRFELSGPPGIATSACGLGIYRDDALGKDYYGNAFTCEPVNQLVHRLVLTPNGLSFTADRAENEMQSEFLTSTDQWFRPVQIRTGPDGALWVVDMYRYVIEHSRWIPQSTLQKVDVYAGQNRGRIYRISLRNESASVGAEKPLIPDLAALSGTQLVALLKSSNGPQRDLAHQLLMWRDEDIAADDPVLRDLRATAMSSDSPLAQLHAFSILGWRSHVDADVYTTLLASDDPRVLSDAIRFAREGFDPQPVSSERLLELATHPDERVRREIAWSLMTFHDDDVAKLIAILGSTDEKSPYVRNAVLTNTDIGNVADNLAEYQRLPEEKQIAEVRSQLIASVIEHGEAQEIESAMLSLLPAVSAVSELNEGNTEWCAPLARALDAADDRYGAEGIELNEAVRDRLLPILIAAIDHLRNAEPADSSILEALTLLGRHRGPFTDDVLSAAEDASLTTDAAILEAVLRPASAKFPGPLQLAAIDAASATDQPRVADALITRWNTVSSDSRDRILDTLLSRADWTQELVSAISSGALSHVNLDAARRNKLLNHSDPEIAELARQSLNGGPDPKRAEVLATFLAVATDKGDAARGRLVFRKLCSNCHRLEDHGHVVGPDLRALTNRDPVWLLTTMLDPNREVDARYVSWTALTQNGRTVSGMLTNESASTVTLREAGGKDHVLLRSELEELQSTNKSFMPEGLEKDLSPQDGADVIAYLAAFQLPPKSFPGNTPKLITPDQRGVLSLTAASAEIRGEDILFEEPFGNVGYWHSASDSVTWRIEQPDAEQFDVYLDASCANDARGNRLRLDGGVEPLTWPVAATGGWDQYRQSRIGTLTLQPGTSTILAHADGSLSGALIDLREIRLVPLGLRPEFKAAAASDVPLPRYPAQIAPFLLDESQSPERRQQVIDDRPGMGAAIVATLVAGLPPENTELEYRLIPWIWRTALAVGKRNDGGEIRDLLDVSLPQPNQPLRDWQAVVIGGGIINGLSQVDEWPGDQIADILKATPELRDRWTMVLAMASDMANDTSVRSGTRYDALRMVALNESAVAIALLASYLNSDNAELQMGSVSGLGDIRSAESTTLLVRALPDLSGRNAQLALAALIRTSDRADTLMSAIEGGKVKLSDADVTFLEQNGSPAIQDFLRMRSSK